MARLFCGSVALTLKLMTREPSVFSHMRNRLLPLSCILHREVTTAQHPGLVLKTIPRRAVDNLVSPVTDGQEAWIQQVVKLCYTSSTPLKHQVVKAAQRRLQVLEEHGCKAYQLLECPQILFTTETELTDSIQQLRDVGIQQMSVPLIASPERASEIEDWLKGAHSIADYWIQTLQYSETEIYYVLQRYPRLLSRTYWDTDHIQDKLDLLQELGVSVKQFKLQPYSFIRISTTELQQQQNKLLTIQEGLKMVETWLEESSNAKLQWETYGSAKKTMIMWMCGFFQRPPEEVIKTRAVDKQSLEAFVAKCDILVKLGFAPDDMWCCQSTFHERYTLKDFRTTVESLEELGVELTSLSEFFSHMTSPGRSVSSIRAVCKALQCTLEDIPFLKRLSQKGKESDMFKYLALQRPAILLQNTEYLQGCGFSLEDLRQCPLVIGHDHSLLVKHWLELPQRSDLQPFSQWDGDQVKLLHVLQYSIEKPYNFRWPVVILPSDHK